MISIDRLQDFVTVALGIVLGALPFVTVGVAVATVVQHALSLPRLVARLPKNAFLRRLCLSLLGVLFPVCECGNVPVARTMLSAGIKPHEALSFLLAAPILNPVVFLTTREAFARTFPEMVWVRMGLGLAIAFFVGWAASRFRDQSGLIEDHFRRDACEAPPIPARGSPWIRALAFFQSEFLTIMKGVVIGAVLASAIQSLVPREAIVRIGDSGFWSVVAMSLLAFTVSICSSVDAFFALSFVGAMPFGALVAFLLLGPMIDIKMFTLLRSTFKTRFVLLLTIILFATVIAIGTLINLFSA